MKVLIADDDPVSRRVLQSDLLKWGYDVTVANDGTEAWHLFEEGDFPLVISDWMMPGMDGPELIRRIRACSKPNYVYTILLTMMSHKDDLVQGMEAGADDFVSKPFDRNELHVRVRAGERIIKLQQALSAQNQAMRAAQDALNSAVKLSES